MRVEVWGRDYRVIVDGVEHFVTPNCDGFGCDCACDGCMAIGAVQMYLAAGGPRVHLQHNRTKGPSICPICGAYTRPWPHSFSYKRWCCDPGGYAHYFQWRGLTIYAKRRNYGQGAQPN